MNKISNIIWGLVLVIIGVIFGLNALDITEIDIFFSGWWTLFIIVPCFVNLFKDENKTGSFIGLLIGSCLLLSCQNIIDFSTIWKLMIPLILVIIGVSIIFKDTINGKVKKEIKKLNKKDMKQHCSTFATQTVDYSDEEFNGCELSAVFGGVTCDLKDAIIKNDAVVDVSAIFGEVTLFVPNNVNVKINSTPIFGGVSDERRKKDKDNKITLYINATCMFGGVEIK